MAVQRLRRWPSIETTLGQSIKFVVHRFSVVLMSVHRLRRWPNIKTTLDQCLTCAGFRRERIKESLVNATVCHIGHGAHPPLAVFSFEMN